MNAQQKKLVVAGGLVLCLVAAAGVRRARASMFGEENITLGKVLVEILHIRKEMDALNDATATGVEVSRDILQTYQRVNAGIEELQGYSWAKFRQDLLRDFAHLYPDLAELRYAREDARRWSQTRTDSPWTAYEVISAGAADVAGLLGERIEAGTVSIDDELILGTEAAGGFAAAYVAEEATRTYDEEVSELVLELEVASPGKAAQIAARAELMQVAQQSHLVRLASRAVRLQGVEMALEYRANMRSANQVIESHAGTGQFLDVASQRPRMFVLPANAWAEW